LEGEDVSHKSTENIQLSELLGYFRLSQAQLARILGVTPRAVNMWCAGDRKVPGTVRAYLRLFEGLSDTEKYTEIMRSKKRART
jgi:DNA-binding transcriptional regulator YiaG